MNAQQLFIRVNQLGFLPNDVKTAVILSEVDLKNTDFEIINEKSIGVEYFGKIQESFGKYGDFPFSYRIDFSGLRKFGVYRIKAADASSFRFSVGNRIYNVAVGELLKFYGIQRCGYTNPDGHEICHIADATSIIENGKSIQKTIDVTGGWHDAGDYTKFLNTTAYTVYTLLLAYELNPEKLSFDSNQNNVPDILEEVKVGVDWLLRANVDNKMLVTQVQDMRDHDVGWRMPEDDPLQFDRPAFVGLGKNLIGIYTAALSLASRIWRDKLNYPEFADKCLTAAENIFSLRTFAPEIDSSTTMYIDSNFRGKLALGAVELYLSNKQNALLLEAMAHADKAGSDFWWSWGDINAYADYRLGKFNAKYIDYLKNNLIRFEEVSDSKVFGEGAAHSWGTTNTLLGITLQNILYKELTGDSAFDSLAAMQRDYIFGMNPWGISFISKMGTKFTRNFHHQIAFLKDEKLPGGFSAGPVQKSIIDSSGIEYSSEDMYAKFQTQDAYYRDDRKDFITNEPTITGNATAIFVLAYFSSGK